MKLRNTEANGSLISKLQSYRLDKLFIVFLLSLSIVACGGNGSSNVSNGGNGNTNVECSDGFGDASRCEARGDL